MTDDDMTRTVTPKSDQLNADDLICGRTITITINRTKVNESGEQKTSLWYDGDNGKPYKPGKMMSHVLIGVWGKSSKGYVGKSMTLYRDDSVTFGPNQVGGIRISHMSHITEPRTVIVPVSKGVRKPFTVKPLVVAEQKIDHDIEKLKQDGRNAALGGGKALDEWIKNVPVGDKKKLADFGPEIRKIANEIDEGTVGRNE